MTRKNNNQFQNGYKFTYVQYSLHSVSMASWRGFVKLYPQNLPLLSVLSSLVSNTATSTTSVMRVLLGIGIGMSS